MAAIRIVQCIKSSEHNCIKSDTRSITLLTTCFGLYILAFLRFSLNLMGYYTNSMVCLGGGGWDLLYNIGWHESEFLGWSFFLYMLQSFVVARLRTLICLLVKPGRLLCVSVIVMGCLSIVWCRYLWNIVTGGLCVGLRILQLCWTDYIGITHFFVGVPVVVGIMDCIVCMHNHYRGFCWCFTM
jgi:hypothetical protein